MQAGRGLIEHVHDAEQIRTDLRREPQPLQLAGRQVGVLRSSDRYPRPSSCSVAIRAQMFCDHARAPQDARHPSAAGVAAGSPARLEQLPPVRVSGNCDISRDIEPGELHRQRFALADACRAHTGQSVPDMNRATRFFISALCVVAKVCST